MVRDVAARFPIDDAAKGRIVRNVKRALVRLFRVIGPTTTAAGDICDYLAADDPLVASTLSDQLNFEHAHGTITALNAFVRDEENTEILAKLARSYATFELHNIDPLGRQFQQLALSRSTILLDTDAILLPRHRGAT